MCCILCPLSWNVLFRSRFKSSVRVSFFVCIHITGSNPFEQYQQRQQEAYQGLQSFFEQQRYMQQQHHILQSLNQCYSQLQQQHQDMAVLQQQFQQLFSYNPSSALSENYPSPQRPFTASPNVANTPPMFMNLPFHSPQQPPFSAPVNSHASFTNAYQPPSSAPVFRAAWHPTVGPVSCSESSYRKTKEGALWNRYAFMKPAF